MTDALRERVKGDRKDPEKIADTGKMMDLRELELIDIESDEQLVRKAKKRNAHHSEKERKKRREIEAWPMGTWASQENSVRKNAGKIRKPEIEEWETEEWGTEEEWEEEQEAGDWEEEQEAEDWGEEQEPDEWIEEEREVRKRPAEKRCVRKPRERKGRKRRKRRARMFRSMAIGFSVTIMIGTLLGAGYLAVRVYREWTKKEDVQTIATIDVEEETNQDIREWAKFYAMELERPALAVDLLTVNEYSRPGEALPEVKSIFVHYTANAGTTAEQNRSYFESLAESHERSASAHFVIGYDGTIVQCIPTKEIAYAVKGRNYDSISIECCYLDENGKFEEKTYQKLIELTAWLLHKYELRPENVLRHYDEGGKNCPKYYVEHEGAWQDFLNDLRAYMTNVTEE